MVTVSRGLLGWSLLRLSNKTFAYSVAPGSIQSVTEEAEAAIFAAT
jgi:hypothetical protein